MTPAVRWVAAGIAGGLLTATLSVATAVGPRELLDAYCIACHNEQAPTAGLALDRIDASAPGAKPKTWEGVIAKLRAGSMPPPGSPRPDPAGYDSVVGFLEDEIDRAWTANPNTGRISAVHRLNRTEYNNAIRDLFALDIDVRPLLPGDETADGSFDNFAEVLSISTTHLERYMSVARQVTRLATGLPPARPTVESFKIPLHVLQNDRQSEDLPLGSRGGIAVRHNFPVEGEYGLTVRLQRQYQDYLKGMGWPQQLDLRLDGKLLKRFSVGGQAQGRPAGASYAGDGEPGFAGAPEWEDYMQRRGDAGLEVRLRVRAGPHTVGVSFVRELWEPEGLPQPLQRGRVITNDQVYMGDFTDLMPTFVELAGAELPAGVTLDGKSIAPVILGKDSEGPRDWMLAMGFGPARLDDKGVRPVKDFNDRVVRDKRYKIHVLDGEVAKLYDLQADPGELNNLIGSSKKEHVAAKKKLTAVVDGFPKTDGRPRYDPLPPQPWDITREANEKMWNRSRRSE